MNLQKFKDWFWVILSLFLVVLIILGALVGKAIYKYGNSFVPARTLSVSASGKTNIIPDIAVVSFSVVSEGRDPAKIAEENTKKMNKAIEFVKGEGIDSKDIKTTYYNLSPKYEYDEKTRTSFISGYVLDQTVSLKIRDFSKISKILGELPNKGINQVSSFGFRVEDEDKYMNVARQEAFKKAYEKAKEMAKYNNMRIGKVVTFSESGSYPVPMYDRYYGKGGGVSTMEAAAPMPSVEPGSQDLTVSVNVTYELK